MPLKLAALIRRYVFRLVLVPAVVVTVVGAILAGAAAYWLEVRAETAILKGNAPILTQLMLSGDSVGLQRQLSALASSRRWTQACLLNSALRVVAAFPEASRVGELMPSLSCGRTQMLTSTWGGDVGRLCWTTDRMHTAVPVVIAFGGVLCLIVWLQASLGFLVGRMISRHTETLGKLAQLLSRRRPLELDELASLEHETQEAAQLVDAVRRFAINEHRLKEIEVDAQRQRALARLAAQVAHDIRSPLSVLQIASTEMSGIPAEKRTLIRDAAAHVRDIANDLLSRYVDANGANGSKPVADAESTACKGDPVMLAPLIERIASEKRLQYGDVPGVVVETTLDIQAYGLFARIDSTELLRALSNLINNAVEALPAHGGRVTIGLADAGRAVLISVRDDGEGIPPHLIASLGTRPQSHGKLHGAGLGVYHAKTTVKKWRGELDIASEFGKGATVTVRLPKAPAPEWLASRIEVRPGGPVVVLDDDLGLHEMWGMRFNVPEVSKGNIELIFCSTPEELRSWVALNPDNARAATYLIDYELGNRPETGLDLALQLGICGRSILVTGRFEEAAIQAECLRLGVKMAPKVIAGVLPICAHRADGASNVRPPGTAVAMKPPAAPKRYDAVLIEDDEIVRMAWENSAAEREMDFLGLRSVAEFLGQVQAIDRRTPIYIDVKLGDGSRGDVESLKIRKLGFREVYLTTGHAARELSGLAHLRGVIGKEPPWLESVS